MLFATYAYAIQIYSDFSGYTDIAIGIALLLGIRFPKNFDSPYRSMSLQDFWRRWHMSLSRWLRDYLYLPLGGNRKGSARTYINLMIVMLLGGLWHGARLKFVLWGGIHGGGLALERLLLGRRTESTLLARGVLPERLVRWLITFHVVCLAWVFFRASDMNLALEALGRLFTGWGYTSPLVTPLLVAVIVLMIASQFVPERLMEGLQTVVSTAPAIAQGVGLALCFFLIQQLGPTGVAPFIYFQF